MQTFETADLYRGAYLLCCGGQLHRTILTPTHRVTFVITGDLNQEDQRYQLDQALVNPRKLRTFLNFLRDIAEERKQNGKTNRGKKTKSRRA